MTMTYASRAFVNKSLFLLMRRSRTARRFNWCWPHRLLRGCWRGEPSVALAKEGSGFGEFRRIPRRLLRGASFSEHSQCPAAGAELCFGVQVPKGAGAYAAPATLVRGGQGRLLVVE